MSKPHSPQGPAPRRTLLRALLAAAVGVGAWALLAGCGDEVRTRGLGDYAFDDPARVYVGNPRLARRPAGVDSSRVYAQIAEYRQIQQEQLADTTPKYHLLMEKASAKFRQAVTAAARSQQVDAVAEAGTIRVVRAGADPPGDLTDEAIAQLQ